jgi:DedD protein
VKERLTGAIILVALIVLLVPELLTGPVASAPRSVAVASSAEEPPLRSYTIKLAEEAHPQGAAAHGGPEQPAPLAPSGQSGASAPAALAQQAPPSPSSAPPVVAPPGGSAEAAAPPSRSAGSPAYIVQLGSFASRANADRLAHQVRTQGFTVSVSQGSSGHLYRVRVGPARDHAAALELAQQLHAHGHDGRVEPQ